MDRHLERCTVLFVLSPGLEADFLVLFQLRFHIYAQTGLLRDLLVLSTSDTSKKEMKIVLGLNDAQMKYAYVVPYPHLL
jgi:hypothetical protein